MQISTFSSHPTTIAALVDLIHYCQNVEAGLNIHWVEQPDVFDIPAHYQQPGGQFWVARTDEGAVAGCIALLPLDDHCAVLKKFFTYPEFRGAPHHLGQQLFDTLLAYAQTHGFKRLVLDTPEAERRSHAFYQHHGFTQVANLDVAYQFPDRGSRFYERQL